MQQDNAENNCGCTKRLQAIRRDVAAMKAHNLSETTGELKKKYRYDTKCAIDQAPSDANFVFNLGGGPFLH